jgi:uncharacterized damage-inducible protein DinB
MDWRAYAVQMADYNRWMNGKVYETCQSIADSDRKKDLGAFFGSIHHTLDHILWADDALLIRLREEDRSIEPYRAPMIADFEELQLRRQQTDAQICQWASEIDNASLMAPYEFVSVMYGKSKILPRYALAMHLFNHQTHHRGQVTTLLSQLGHDVGITDLPWVPDTAS